MCMFSFYQRSVVCQQDYGFLDGFKSNIWGHDLHHTKVHHVELLHKVEEVLCLGVFFTMRKQAWGWTIVVKTEWSHKAKLCIYLELSNPKGAKLAISRQTKDHGKRPCLTSHLIFRSPRKSGVAREREIWSTQLPMQSDPLIIDYNVDGIIVGEPFRWGRCLPPAWCTLVWWKPQMNAPVRARYSTEQQPLQSTFNPSEKGSIYNNILHLMN